MTPKEQEIAINELEERVDRLRNIYEQYFLGFEKLEPTVPRKDVDRRFAILRKEQIRNTAMRFRFNVVTQKYNTYSMHWVRICRQIEEGTYKRHVRRAKARFGDGASVPERDYAIDVELGDFESMDMDEVLAEANAAVESYERNDVQDTVPPPPPSARVPDRTSVPRQMIVQTPGTSFAIGGPDRGGAGRRETIDVEPRTPGAMTGIRPAPDRAARPAPLPPGAKPRVLLRKRGDDPDAAPPSRTLPGVPAEVAESAARLAAAQPTSAPRMPAPSSPNFATGANSPRPSGPRIAPAAASSAGGGPSSPGGAASGGRLPAAQPASASRMPIPAPMPMPRPAASAGRLPAAAPLPAPSAGRLPVAAAPGSRPNPGGPPPRPPMPSITEKDEADTIPPPPPSVPRSRAPLPLPSQMRRPPNKE